MQRLTSFVLGLFLFIGGLATALAQEKTDGLHQPPKVLVIAREFLKPGKAGMTHQKSEAAFVQAFATAKWPTYYLAINSMSGKPRSLFLTGYDSFEAVEKDNKAVEKNGTLTTALDRASLNDGELLSDFDQGVFVYREDLSLHAATDIPHMRYFEIMNFRVKPGHEKEFEALAKIYINSYDKVPDTHWAAYEVAYGSLGNTILLFSPLKTASEIDHNFVAGKQIEEEMGEDTMKKARELAAASIESSQTNLFSFEPKMSYVSPEWAKADPTFWHAKTVVAAGPKKAAETAKKQ
ncbi:MAG TPA: hypothetical protein VJX16_17270 [Terriglobales bacterium]|nr:hypothetical protein [Terriglobales bacterium]